jgi:hypothetical protein
MPYRDIAAQASEIRARGYTHVQFPPIQPTLVLSEHDGALLRAQVKASIAFLPQLERMVRNVREKVAVYAPHSFDFLLKERIACIGQPTVRALYTAVLEGAMTPHADYETVLRTGPSAVAKAVLDCVARGQRSPWYAMVRAADLVLEGIDPNAAPDFTALDAAVAVAVADRTAWLRLKHERHRLALSAELAGLLAAAAEQRAAVLECTEFTAPPTKPFGATALRHWNRTVLLEYMVYPPWWIVYQPTHLAIGPTPLGSMDDIKTAIRACAAQTLGVIADIVVNNLAAVGERDAWAPMVATHPDAHTCADLLPTTPTPPHIVRLRARIREALGTEDMTTLLPPFACGGTQEPTCCWMSQALPQLNQDHPAVQAAQHAFLAQLAAAGVTSLRIDAAVHMSPAHCQRIVDTFAALRGDAAAEDLSYIEYVGGSESWRAFPFETYRHIRMEDFAIGECLYKTLFGPRADLVPSKNYGGTCLSRHPSLESVVMLINHDQLQGTLPPDIYTDLPSRYTYDLSLVYLLQRIYGAVLLLPHQDTSPVVQQALAFRARMRERGIVREYVAVTADSTMFHSYKYDTTGTCVGWCTIDLTHARTEEAVTFVWAPATAVPTTPPHPYSRRTIRWRHGRRVAAAGRRTRRCSGKN